MTKLTNQQIIIFILIAGAIIFLSNQNIFNNEQFSVNGGNNIEICTQQCVPLYYLENNSCTFNSCGSGCGANNITRFTTESQCLSAAERNNNICPKDLRYCPDNSTVSRNSALNCEFNSCPIIKEDCLFTLGDFCVKLWMLILIVIGGVILLALKKW